MNAMNITPFLAILISAVIAIVISHLIDFLYSLPNAPLSFPKKKAHPHIFRKIFLSVMLFVALISCENLTFSLLFYKMTAIIFLLVITVTDFEQYIIFDIVILGFALAGICFSVLLELPLFERFIAAFCGGAAFFALLVVSKNGIGGGDVKLVAALGLWLGADKLLSTILTASILGGICALFLLLSGIKSRTDYFAYGPYICIAAAWQLFQ